MGSNGDSAHTYYLQNMHTHPFFWNVLAASTVGWLLGFVKGFSSTLDWLGKYMASPPRLLTFILDALIFVAVGAYLGTGLFSPDSFLEACAAGVTWPVVFGSLATGGLPGIKRDGGTTG